MDDSILAREAQLIFDRTKGFDPAPDSLQRWIGQVQVRHPRYGTHTYSFEVIIPDNFPYAPPIIRSLSPIRHPNIDPDGTVHLKILHEWKPRFHVYQAINSLQTLLNRSPPIPLTGPSPKQPTPPTPSQPASSATTGMTTEIPTFRPPKHHSRHHTTWTAPSTAQTGVVTAPPAQQAIETRLKTENSLLKQELDRLRTELQKKEEELARMQAHLRQSNLQDTTRIPMQLSDQEKLASEQYALEQLLEALHDKYSNGEVSIYEFAKLYKKYSKELYLIKKQLEYLNQ